MIEMLFNNLDFQRYSALLFIEKLFFGDSKLCSNSLLILSIAISQME